jgi:hypothetical protein
MAYDFRDYIYRLSPAFLRDYWGQRLMGILGLSWDGIAEGATIAVGATKLYSDERATDVLDLIGEERMLPRFPDETDTDYEARLHDAWELWQQAGTRNGIAQMFDRWGGKVLNHARNADWNWDAQPSNWSRIWVILFDHGWTEGPALGDPDMPALGDPSWTLGSTATPDEVRAARNIVRSFKEAHATCVNVIVVLDEAGWSAAMATGPDGTWNNPVNRSPSACYWDG